VEQLNQPKKKNKTLPRRVAMQKKLLYVDILDFFESIRAVSVPAWKLAEVKCSISTNGGAQE
jgi:hypothetical protein